MRPPVAKDDGGDGAIPGAGGVTPSRWRIGPAPETVTGPFSRKTDFVSVVVSGLLIGLVLDRLLGTSPWLTIGWTLLAFGYGFWRLWHTTGEVVAEMERHGHGV